jgi:hypothetical protein
MFRKYVDEVIAGRFPFNSDGMCHEPFFNTRMRKFPFEISETKP